ncbi:MULTISPECIES: DoxX family protein [Salinibaculum]|uniref:DoxX family protein n=1 Tax=Salinibaculum TaxID=2732368 RepID=UPI0030CDFC69
MIRSATAATAGALLALVAVASGRASAHVDYVTDPGPPGSPADLFRAVLTTPESVLLLAGGFLALVAVVAAYVRFASAVPDIDVARATLRSYRPYLPWMLRLSVGLPLVGAGFAGYLFTPSVPADARLLQVGIGFLLLFGLATRVVAAIGLLTYVYALVTAGAPMLLASEYVAGFVGILLVGPGQPSADVLLRRLVVTDGTIASRFRGVTTPGEVLGRLGLGPAVAPVPVRVFLGLNFLYLGVVQKLLEPQQALAVVDRYDLTAVVPVQPELWVVGAGLTEALVGVALILGAFTRGTAALGFLILTSTLFGLPDDPVLAHVTLFGLTSVLLVTGAGRPSLDGTVLPSLRRRFDPGADQPSGTTVDRPL